VLYTPGVTNTPRTVEHDVSYLWRTVGGLPVRTTWYAEQDTASERQRPDVVLVDEADRVKTASLEQLRDFYDRRHGCCSEDALVNRLARDLGGEARRDEGDVLGERRDGRSVDPGCSRPFRNVRGGACEARVDLRNPFSDQCRVTAAAGHQP
jgi:hypothetical protein